MELMPTRFDGYWCRAQAGDQADPAEGFLHADEQRRQPGAVRSWP